MAQQPFFTSHTPIAQMDTRLAGSIGDRFGAGLQQGVQAFAAGIEKKRAKEEKKRQDEQALQFVKSMAPRLGLDPSDEDTLKAGIEGMGGGAEVLRFGAMLQQHEQQAKQQAIALREAEAAERDQMALSKALPGVLRGSMTASEDGAAPRFDVESFSEGLIDAGVRPQTALAWAERFARNPEAAVEFIQNPNTGQNYAVRGNTLLREPAAQEGGRKAGDLVPHPALGRDVVWAERPQDIIDSKTGEALYLLKQDPVTGVRTLQKNPKVWPDAAQEQTGKVEIPPNLFGGVNW